MAESDELPPRPEPVQSPATLRWGRRFGRLIARFHKHQIRGLDAVPARGPALLVCSHSLATYDALLAGLAIYEGTGRAMVGLGDNLIFRLAPIRALAEVTGIFRATPENGQALLDAGYIVGVAPGGMREALRPSSERYRVRWQSRVGFIKLAIRAGAPIVLAACPRADNIYSVYESPLTKIGYKYFKLPIPIIRGWGPTLLPRPVRLVHRLAGPFQPPPFDPPRFEEQVEDFHAEICQRMDDLMLLAR